ncbi:MAG TPA: hypothetical protein VHB21_22185, partial [Minicystis sp.]|nr:hypothetical protein [Minicystis sp.]
MRRVLVVDADAPTRALAERVLSGTAAAVTATASLAGVPATATFDAAVVDEVAGAGAVLAELATARERWPTLPIVLTGTLLSPKVLVEAIRLGVVDALAKPFLPDELRAAPARALAATPRRAEALELDAALAQ